ncbi:MAG: FAD-binding oxidoreductase [Chloroflexi bacterium]|nr:FAD-binding oxidoreductase [Chloroflexota bacterium]
MTDVYDFAVIGAGVFGLSSAWQLAKEGHTVAVIDRSPVGTEASGFALGRVDPPLTDTFTDSLMLKGDAESIAGLDTYTALACASYSAHHRLRSEIEGVSGIDYEFDERLMIELLPDERSRRIFSRDAAQWTAAGVKTELIDPVDFARFDDRLIAPAFGGAVISGGFFVDSLKLAKALEECAYASGATFITAEAIGVRVQPGNAVVETSTGDVTAARVLVALGPWTGDFTQRLGQHVAVYPSKGELLRLVPPEGPSLKPHLHGEISMVQKRDGLFWVAATADYAGFDRTPTGKAANHLRNAVVEVAPWMADAPAAAHTACFRPETPDGLPLAGRLGDMERIWVTSGGFGWGIMYCLAMGEAVASMMVTDNDETDIRGLRPDRFPPDASAPQDPRKPGRAL